MEIKSPEIKFGGKFSCRKFKADGSECAYLDLNNKMPSGGSFNNALLDRFFTHLISTNSLITIIRNTWNLKVGTSATPVSFGQSGLLGYVASASGSVLYSGVNENGFLKITMTCTATFALGALNGNFSEVGARIDGNLTADSQTHSRALITDPLGNPTAITVNSDEQLVLTYELTMWVPSTIITGSFDALINGTPTTINYEMGLSSFQFTSNANYYLCNVASSPYTWYENALIGAPGSGLANVSNSFNGATATSAFNVAGGKETTLSLSISQVAFNIQGLSASLFKYTFNPKLPKTNARTLALTFRQTFGRL